MDEVEIGASGGLKFESKKKSQGQDAMQSRMCKTHTFGRSDQQCKFVFVKHRNHKEILWV